MCRQTREKSLFRVVVRTSSPSQSVQRASFRDSLLLEKERKKKKFVILQRNQCEGFLGGKKGGLFTVFHCKFSPFSLCKCEHFPTKITIAILFPEEKVVIFSVFAPTTTARTFAPPEITCVPARLLPFSPRKSWPSAK